ncbi:ubiquinol-cytochrome C chaperone family protein [Sphingomonas prati]|uniref:Cytochrome b pre-mRNA-processing protein 3 n=1 Tax=Sphingomonas prati TaxID=1843237 RepID=A0A7W9BTR5_9SPHN|nr:ubiquinol-cytochrome C chaperone family protein [Sphingomonas prati]MBB5729972.1 cytochrome b pre-mRNA-processing protein 3 [Sphingomonas prati]
MSFLTSLFKSNRFGADADALYAAIVAAARRPAWYREGRVPDTMDGRFDMVAAVTAIALIRLERDGAVGNAAATRLTEAFVDDMDGQLREAGVGDVVVGKHIGKMVSALGGRLTAYREALAADGTEGGNAFEDALRRNLYRGEDPGAEAVAYVAAGLRRVEAGMAVQLVPALLEGHIA